MNGSPSPTNIQMRETLLSGIPEEDFVRIRFAGDSGDGVQLTGMRFAESAALYGNDFATFPDYPAEIRAPAGTIYGVSAYSINIGRIEVMTSGDESDVLIAFNPAALRTHLPHLRYGGLIIVDDETFTKRNLAKANYTSNPLDGDTLARFRILRLGISALTLLAVKELELGRKDALRCKNMWTLGLVLWMFGRKKQPVIDWLRANFKKSPKIAEANECAFRAGHAYGETIELGSDIRRYTIPPAPVKPGIYRTVTGSETLSWGLYAGSRLAGLKAFLGSYPITPASNMLHILARLKDRGVVTFQAEDEIAAICAAIGASYAGSLGITTSSGPGIALKTEALGLAVSAELPLVVVNVQRGGPSTGLPTKTEQSDLFQAIWGRNGDAPIPVMATATPSDCFDVGIEAICIATKYMTPVIVLSDGYIANAAEPWKLPDMEKYTPFLAEHYNDPQIFYPFLRDSETLARPWSIPGTPGLAHRIGGLEKDYETGNVSYVPENHQKMTKIRRDKILGIEIPNQVIDSGPDKGCLAILGWGSTYGAIRVATRRARALGMNVAHIHLRYIWPLPKNLEKLLSGFDTILVPEMNMGQLVVLLRSQMNIGFTSISKVTGQPFRVKEILEYISQAWKENSINEKLGS